MRRPLDNEITRPAGYQASAEAFLHGVDTESRQVAMDGDEGNERCDVTESTSSSRLADPQMRHTSIREL